MRCTCKEQKNNLEQSWKAVISSKKLKLKINKTGFGKTKEQKSACTYVTCPKGANALWRNSFPISVSRSPTNMW